MLVYKYLSSSQSTCSLKFLLLRQGFERTQKIFTCHQLIKQFLLCCFISSSEGPGLSKTSRRWRGNLWAKMPAAVGGPQGYTPPEGGWGWMVVAGAFISIGFSYAFPKSITVFFKEIELIFDVTSSQVSWISSIMLAVMYGGGEPQSNAQHVKRIYGLNQFLPLNTSVKSLLLQCSVQVFSSSTGMCSAACQPWFVR